MARCKSSFRIFPAFGALLIAAFAVRAQASTHLLNFYVGAGLGDASLRANDSGLVASSPDSLGGFDRGDFAYQIMAGVRGLYLLGAEIDYFHLGSGGVSPSYSGPFELTEARISQKGEAAFAMLYLPVPIVDIYLKAGIARLMTALSATVSRSCRAPALCIEAGPPFTGNVDTSETTLAAGAGVQWKLGDWAVRAEYERFAALGAHPDLLTVGVTWSIL
ncbi:MAG: outer membrane beta-barrel protein [Steroidobacteraceae bacterium]